MTGPACGNNPNYRMSDGDRRVVEDFKAYLDARGALRDRIAAALYAHDHPSHVVPLNETGMEAAYRESAAAVLAVLPATTDQTPDWDALVREADRLRRDGAALQTRAAEIDAQLAALRKQVAAPADGRAVLHAAADRIDRTDLPQDDVDCFDNGARWATKLLRRMADETQPAETDDLRAALARVERLALTFEVAGNEFIAEQIRAAVGAQPAEETHVVADDSNDPEHVDDCPGCTAVGARQDGAQR